MAELRNDRWELFAKLTAKGFKRGEAYTGSGFTAKKHGKTDKTVATNRGSSLYSNHPEIQARVEEILNEDREEALITNEITREFVLKNLKDNHDRASAAVPVLDRSGRETGTFKIEGNVANRSLELMGKELGMFADRMIFESLDSELEGMNETQLRNFIRGAATEVGLRMVDMNPEEMREFIISNAPRCGLRIVEEGWDGTASAEDAEDSSVSAVPETTTVPRTRPH